MMKQKIPYGFHLDKTLEVLVKDYEEPIAPEFKLSMEEMRYLMCNGSIKVFRNGALESFHQDYKFNCIMQKKFGYNSNAYGIAVSGKIRVLAEIWHDTFSCLYNYVNAEKYWKRKLQNNPVFNHPSSFSHDGTIYCLKLIEEKTTNLP